MRILGKPLGMQHAPAANLQGQNNPPPPGPAIPQAQNNPPGAANPQAQNNPLPAGPANLQAPNNPASAANLQAQNNPAIQVIIPAGIQAVPPMGILGTPLGMQEAPQADIPGAVALMVEDPGFEYLGMARRVPRAMSDLS